jgi:hypothetical protein
MMQQTIRGRRNPASFYFAQRLCSGFAIRFLELLEKNGGDDGTRTRDLCRDRAAF